MKIIKFDYIVKQSRLAWEFLALKRIDNLLIGVILIYVVFNCLQGKEYVARYPPIIGKRIKILIDRMVPQIWFPDFERQSLNIAT